MVPFGILKQNDHLEEHFRGRRNGLNKVDLGMCPICWGDGKEVKLTPKGKPCW